MPMYGVFRPTMKSHLTAKKKTRNFACVRGCLTLRALFQGISEQPIVYICIVQEGLPGHSRPIFYLTRLARGP